MAFGFFITYSYSIYNLLSDRVALELLLQPHTYIVLSGKLNYCTILIIDLDNVPFDERNFFVILAPYNSYEMYKPALQTHTHDLWEYMALLCISICMPFIFFSWENM